ncbi:PREDICTED: coiled-coil domain-containing protein 105-like [Amphimedon queenslandica]|uniref:Coiled-coil domain-containing protein 105 n=1 Tax=Amphimedon queenslandica TaxID=400682 RepID=A0A1X7VBG5_AMPQE|nr:PREDICTED: coiled-coil domain-containing protein 105-like [Amphimedon queenslandica]|eukprot:XP_003384874.1 PREDICTED: coiled-coil domain-containing protein 105-like [Amphimedon queenslandica]
MASVGPEQWKESTIAAIKVAQTLIVRAEEKSDQFRRKNPLPSLRDSCINESNKKIHSYARATREVVIRLKQVIAAVNEEIKALNRVRQQLERSLDHCRKDITMNTQCVSMRLERPMREQCPSDGADHLLGKEHKQLFQQKNGLECRLKNVLAVLQMLNASRSALTSVMQERSRTTELLCHSVSSNPRSTQPTTSPRHIKALSAPAIFLGSHEQFGPLSSVTPATTESIQRALDLCQKSSVLRHECAQAIEMSRQHQSSMQQLVNDALTQKIAETVTLEQHLLVNSGETKLTEQRSSRLLKQQEKSLGYLLGPESSADITKRERLDRPLVKVYQQHPGTDLPEAATLLRATASTMESIAQTQRNLSLLKLARKKLMEDYRDKKIASHLDSDVYRMRRRKADHRWVIRGSNIPLQLPISK